MLKKKKKIDEDETMEDSEELDMQDIAIKAAAEPKKKKKKKIDEGRIGARPKKKMTEEVRKAFKFAIRSKLKK